MGRILVLGAEQRPELPALDPAAMAEVKYRVEIIVRHHVALPRLPVNREQGEVDLIAEEAVLDRAVKGEDRGVIFPRQLGSLLEVDREQGEAAGVGA